MDARECVLTVDAHNEEVGQDLHQRDQTDHEQQEAGAEMAEAQWGPTVRQRGRGKRRSGERAQTGLRRAHL